MRRATETKTAAPLSVAQVAARVGSALRALGDGWVEGEVTQINLHRASGHVYLTLADESASLDACIWRGRVEQCKPLPVQGELVQAHYERVDFYARRGATKLIVDRMRPTGEGELLRRRAETLRRLQADGLCDPERRKQLPAFPRRVGVIAARGDANVDVIQALRRRFPPQSIVFCAASVQGVHAVGSMIDALGQLQSVEGVDVIVIARGGGSTADLVAFDDERLCRAIFACAKPVITSIGHTKDRPNCDRVAAAFAPVPAKAAELAIRRSAEELLADVKRGSVALNRVKERAGMFRAAVAQLGVATAPLRRLESTGQEVERQGRLAQVLTVAGISRQKAQIAAADQMLDATRRTHSQSIDVVAAQLNSTHRRTASKLADLLAAIDRRLLQIESGVRSSTSRRAQGLAADCARSTPAARWMLARDRERFDAILAVLAARDFRRNGWTIATDERGEPMRSIAQLVVGGELTLHLADGSARVTTTQTEEALDG